MLEPAWWPSGLTYDVTAVKSCMVSVRLQVRIPLEACMSRKGPEVGQGMLDFVEDLSKGVDSH